MLILTRRIGETLIIGDNITVTVLGVKGNQVRIGVNAPDSVNIVRDELLDDGAQEISRIAENNNKKLCKAIEGST